MFAKPEADLFAEVAIRLGVPAEKIIIENKSTNTGENIRFTQEILKSRGLTVNSMILLQKPYMERRTFATFMKQWKQPEAQPPVEIIVSSPQISYDEYPNAEVTKEVVINAMVGDLQRIKHYPIMGFQIEQHIPDDVWEACEELVRLGYNKHVLKLEK